MKKIALGSALGSGIALMFSAPVFAQSSVTLYGVIDEGINYTNNVGGKSLVEMASGFAQGSRWGQGVYEVYGTGQLVVGTGVTTYTLIPGLMQTIYVPDNSVVHVHTDGGVQSTGATSATFSVVDIGLFVDGAATTTGGQRRLSIANTSSLAQLIANWSIDHTYSLPAGNHTFDVRAVSGAAGSSAANVSSGSAPQLRGVLTVTIINR